MLALPSKDISHILHVECAAALLFPNAASSYESAKSTVIYDTLRISCNDIFAGSKSYNVQTYDIQFKECVSYQFEHLQRSYSVFLLYNLRKHTWKFNQNLGTLSATFSSSFILIFGPSAAGLENNST